MKKIEFILPRPILLGAHYKFWRSEIEFEKVRLAAAAMGRKPPEYKKPDVDYLVGSADVAREFGFSSRTLTRRIRELESRIAVQDTQAS